MKGRIESMLGQEMADFWCGTFHGIAHRLLRRHWEEANLRKEFAILDSEDPVSYTHLTLPTIYSV